MELVNQHRAEHGLSLCLKAAGLSPSTSYYRQNRQRPDERDADLRAAVVEVIADCPDFGYRRIAPELSKRLGRNVNTKAVRRVLRTYQLGLRRALPQSRPSAVREVLDRYRGHLDVLRQREEPIGVFEALSTDFSELQYAGGTRKAYVSVYLDIGSKFVPGFAVGPSANRSLALEAWARTKRSLEEYDTTAHGVIVHSDQDSVYTSHDYLSKLLVDDHVRISFSERGCRDNPWIESFWGRMKTEIRSEILEAATLEELIAVIERRIDYYNQRRRHSAIGNIPPITYLQTRKMLEAA